MQNDDFVCVVDDVITNETCTNVINAFELAVECGSSYGRSGKEAAFRKDTSISFCSLDMEGIGSLAGFDTLAPVSREVHKHIEVYMTKYFNGMFSLPPQLNPLDIDGFPAAPSGHKIQKTSPSEGYHMWHCEYAPVYNNRLLSWLLYLNEVEGGETEFLYLSKRVEPKAGRLIIFPCGFTHTHRGNPPLSGDKYLATGWVVHT
jgi:hypothetical protein